MNCPLEVLTFCIENIETEIQIENFQYNYSLNSWNEVEINLFGKGVNKTKVMNFSTDLIVSKESFLENLDTWNANGVYAICCSKLPLPFKASDLPEKSRFNALSNFGFKLEFALAGPNSSGLSSITSTEIKLLEMAKEIILQNRNKTSN